MLAEDLRARFSPARKMAALVRSYLDWSLAAPGDAGPANAVVLFTSGSESLPKAVPLTHANLLTNVRDVLEVVAFLDRDVLIGMLPPFHSFGMTVRPCCRCAPACGPSTTRTPPRRPCWPRVIDAYRVTFLVGTPTFLNGICPRCRSRDSSIPCGSPSPGPRSARPRSTRRWADACPGATILEGYGITECSPVVSANRPEKSIHGSIGRALASVECAIVGLESGDAVAPARPGCCSCAARASSAAT